MADVSSTTGASSSRLMDSTPFRRDHHQPPAAKVKTMPTTNGGGSTPKHPAAVARRNARERNRVRQVNMGFVTLRNHIPQGGSSKSKKLSKVETLRQAATYIQYLREMLTAEDAINGGGSGAFASACMDSATMDLINGSGFFFNAAAAGSPSGDSYYGNNPSPYSSNNVFPESAGHSQPPPPQQQQQQSTPFGSTAAHHHQQHLKISPISSTDSPQSSSFASSTTSSSDLGMVHGGIGYECVTPPHLRSYNAHHVDQKPHMMAPYGLPSHCQPPHSMPMYS